MKPRHNFAFERTGRLLQGLLFVTCLDVLSRQSFAATRTWDGGGADNNWTTAANWDVAIAAGDDLVFPGTAPADSLATTNDFALNTAFNSLTISGTNYILRGNGVVLTNGLSGQTGGTNTVLLNMQLNASQKFDCTVAAGFLQVSGNVNLNGRDLTNQTTGAIQISGVISGTGNVVKTGAGTLRFGGATGNAFVGTTTVNDGTLELNKNVASAVPGALMIGDSAGTIGSATVRLASTNQISDSSTVTIEDDGLLDLNGFPDTIGSLTVIGGDITTGAGSLTLGGDVASNSSTNQATISGNLNLGGAIRTMNVAFASINPELVISAVITNGGITKSGTGRLRFSGTNTYAGTTTITSGFIIITTPFALGSTAAGTTLSGGYLSMVGVTVAGETLTNTSISSALQSSSAAGWSENVVLNSTLQLQVLSGTNDISGAISGAGGLIKTQPGTLMLSGPTDNTYGGTTTVNEGTLLLNKSPNVVAIPGALTIGDGLGGPNADVVRLQGDSQIQNLAPVTITSSGLLDSDGFLESVGGVSGTGNLQLDNSIFSVGFIGDTVTFDGTISGSDTLIRNGTGIWILNATNTFSGNSTINGTTFVNGILPANIISVFGTLGGTGTVGKVDIGTTGTLSPGLSAGRLTSSNLTFLGSSMFRVELNGTTPGAGHDQMKVNGTVTLGSATLNATLGFLSASGNSFTIIDNDGSEAVTNTFLGLPEGATVNTSGTPFVISYTGGTGNDVVLTQLAATQPPILNIQSSAATNVVLSWATNFTGYTLEANADLSTSFWSVVSPAPAVSGTNNVVTNAAIESGKFYRLRAP